MAAGKACLESTLEEEAGAQASFAARVLREDPDVAPGWFRMTLPFMVRVKCEMGMSQTTLRFAEKGFSSGFRYVGEAPRVESGQV